MQILTLTQWLFFFIHWQRKSTNQTMTYCILRSVFNQLNYHIITIIWTFNIPNNYNTLISLDMFRDIDPNFRHWSHLLHSHFWYLHVLSQKTFSDWKNVSLLTLEKTAFKILSLRLITWALIYIRCHETRPVNYYAFFKGWLLLSPPPNCHRSITVNIRPYIVFSPFC